MRPFLYYSPDFSIPSFAFALMLASLAGTYFAYRTAPKRGLSQIAILDLAIIGTLMAVIGGRLFHVFAEEPRYYWEHPSHIYQIWLGGFVSYGAFIGLGTGWIVYCKWKHLDTLAYLDHVGLFTGPFIDFFVRLGCLMAGCCFGKPSPFHKFEYLLYIKFTNPSSDAGSLFPGVALYPTQIYSMIAAILIFLVCYQIDKHKKFKGQVMMSFLLLYAVSRFFIEFLRGDVARKLYFGGAISTGQIMSILFFFGALGFYLYLRKAYPVAKTSPAV